MKHRFENRNDLCQGAQPLTKGHFLDCLVLNYLNIISKVIEVGIISPIRGYNNPTSDLYYNYLKSITAKVNLIIGDKLHPIYLVNFLHYTISFS